MSTGMFQPRLEPLQPSAMVPASFEVVEKRQDTVDVWTLELVADCRVSRSNLSRASSRCSRPAAPARCRSRSAAIRPSRERLVHTVRAVGLATDAICAAEPGQVLSVRGPFGRPWPVEPAGGPDVMIAAGGIGLAPLRPAILCAARGAGGVGRLSSSTAGVAPSSCSRRRAGHLDWARTRGARHGRQRGRGVAWACRRRDPAGRQAKLDPRRTVALSCGPEVMMRFTVAGLANVGVSIDRIYVSMERNMQCGDRALRPLPARPDAGLP